MMASIPNFERSISLNDLDSSSRVREQIQADIVTPEDETKHCHLGSMSELTFVLKSFKDMDLDFKKFLYSYLLDVGIYKELEENKKLNWCSSLFPMVPVLTLGDGNCLMHAASIGMWAVNDRYHTLRKLTYNALLEDMEGIFHKRWQREIEKTSLRLQGYSMTEEQWAREWKIVLQLVSQEEYPNGPNGMQYESLEEIHIFVLANVLRRTIIVISSDTLRGNYDESLSPLNFGGIYLPLNWDPIECVKTPLVIGYSQGHFTSIVSFEDGVFDQGEQMDDTRQFSSKIHGIPLQKHDGAPLPIHFLFENEEDLIDGLLRQYLDCKKLTHKNPDDGSLTATLVAKLNFVPPPDSIKALVDVFFSRAMETYQHMIQTKGLQSGDTNPSLVLQRCRTQGCEFFGNSETLFLCSKCLEKYLQNEGNQMALLTQNVEFLGTGNAFKKDPFGGSAAFTKESSSRPAGAKALFREEFPATYKPQEKRKEVTKQQQQQQQRRHNYTAEILQQQRQEIELLQLQQQQQEMEMREMEILQQQQEQQREMELLQEQQQQQREMEILQEQQQQREVQLLQQQQQQQRETELLHQQQQRRIQYQQPKKCITHGCKYNADEATGNLCFRCYESEMEAEHHASIVSMNVQAKPCANRVNGCPYYGIPQQENFCSRCYRMFRLEMETLVDERNNEGAVSSAQSAAVSSSPEANDCQTLGCQNAGCQELYGRCVECYSKCIKNFITSHEGSQLASSSLVPPSPQRSSSPRPTAPPPPSPQGLPSELPTVPQVLPSSQLGQTSPIKRRLCKFAGCQNQGVPVYNGKCEQCHEIIPFDYEHPVPLTSKTRQINVSTNTTPGSASAAHAPTAAAGLSSGEPSRKEGNQRLYCKTAKCNNPVAECNSLLCTHCIMDNYDQEAQNLPQQLHNPPPPSGGSGAEKTEEQLSRETLEAGLGVAGFGAERIGQDQLQGSASEERKKAAAIARRDLPPLYIPPSSARASGSAPQPGGSVSANTPGGNILCVAPNCKYYGSAEQNYYCSTCYEKNREQWKKISHMAEMRSRHQDRLVQEPLIMVTEKPKKMRSCALTYCYNIATPGNNGLCDRCYRTALTHEKEWQSTNRTRSEPQRQPPAHVPTTTSTVTTTTRTYNRPLKKNFIDAGAPCKTPGCLKFGTTAKQGLCEPCYEQLQRKQSSRAPSSTSGPSNVTVCVAQQRTSRPSGWTNSRRDQLLTTTTFSAQGPIPVTQQSTRQLSTGAGFSSRCKQEGCVMTGSPETGGYCSKCFVDYTRQSSYSESVPDRNNSSEGESLSGSSSDSPLNGLSLTDTSTTATATVTGGLTTLQTGTPKVCAVEGCENIVTSTTVLHCQDCIANH